jgi:hypothetical protein
VLCTVQLPLVFCSAADGTNVVKMFNDAIEAAIRYKENPPSDFVEDVLRVDDYFREKEQKEKADKEKAAKDKADRDKADKEKADVERIAKEKAAKDKAEFERALKLQNELAAKKAEKDRAAAAAAAAKPKMKAPAAGRSS